MLVLLLSTIDAGALDSIEVCKFQGGDSSGKIQGSWDSIHVIEVQEKTSGKNAHYKLTSTVMLWLKTMFPDSGTVSLGGSLMRQFVSSESPSSPIFRHYRSERNRTVDVPSVL